MGKGMGSRRIRAVGLTCAMAVGLIVGAPQTGLANPGTCSDGWEVGSVVSGIGNLENLDSDGAGGFYVTGILDGYLAHVDARGRVEKLVTGLKSPAGVRVAGKYVYFVTGDGFMEEPGTLERYDRETRTVTTLLTGLNGPNGLLLLPDGDLLFTNIGVNGVPSGISRYRPSTGEYTKTWANVPLSNGIALAPDGTSIFADNLTLRIFRIPLNRPSEQTVVAGVPQLMGLLDDMEATRAGQLFVADHMQGAIYQVDTATGTACSIVTGLIKSAGNRNPPDGATSVRIARDGDTWALYATSMDGTLYRLRPPAGLDLTPATPQR
ncbi:SMP-30/gluconolactonase/LRE family protein [Nocardia sp. XZ_19_385]|uniref:SMP-30/gluconolactonase/LRE family protein n=1 Tax=Nocardia sp. XZ_19_385 TaxID=2769488 RepID=UPI00188EC8D1|nr:SMP-30/gluconolactonase/LRE family protein [Nocardia sp. XZ_19_385]